MITKEEWFAHFLSVSSTMGIYEGEYWSIIDCGSYWNIVGNQVGFVYHSVPNGDKTEYTDLEILLKDFKFLDICTRSLLGEDVSMLFSKDIWDEEWYNKLHEPIEINYFRL